MRVLSLAFVAVTGAFLGCLGLLAQPTPSKPPANGVAGEELSGKTQPAAGRSALICPVPLHPVERVLVKVGDAVKKDQVLVELDADEPKADVRTKEANLESCRVLTQHLQERLQQMEPLHSKGSISDQKYLETKFGLAKAQADERAAQAALESSKAELEHYTLTAAIDGVIASLDVVPGQVSRPGTTVWGQILDLSVIEVRCDVSAALADTLSIGQTAEIALNGAPKTKWIGTVATIGIAADRKTGLIPVLLRVENPAGKLRCYVDVRVRFMSTKTAQN
jgi:membrane fusion protein (multidrug efflux system)